MKLIIAGSRGFLNYELLKKEALDFIESSDSDTVEIVSGTASGADTLGERLAKEKNFNLKKFPANWSLFGKQAGYIRNKEMAKYADACIVFWDGRSRGTKHMIDIARERDLPLKIVMTERV